MDALLLRRRMLAGVKAGAEDYSLQYLTFEVTTGGTFGASATADLPQYSLDGGLTWNNYTESLTLNAGDKILWKRTQTAYSENILTFTSGQGARCKVTGNAMSVVFGDNFIGQTDMTGRVFTMLFYEFEAVTDASNMVLPATTLGARCYRSMFNRCSSLVAAPELPAETMAEWCYAFMFYGCSSLVSAPELPATALAEDCYDSMFWLCTSLVTAPELPATTLANACYSYMFRECTSLLSAPALPAEAMAEECYSYMFYGCNFITAPVLPATALAKSCYSSMFYGCTSLVNAPALPATTLADSCYANMFRGCTSLVTAPVLPAVTLVTTCYAQMFRDCSSLNYIKALFTTRITSSNHGYTNSWVYGVAASGTFVKSANARWTLTGDHGVPNNWTIETE